MRPEQIERCLLVLAINGGNAAASARQLAEEGIEVDATTLRRYKRETHAQRYAQVEATYSREMEESIVGLARDNALAAALLEAELIERTRNAMPTMSSRDAAQAARNISDVKSKNIDKLLALTGRPAERERNEDIVALLRSMVEGKLLRPSAPEAQSVINGTATEVGETE